jgi:hypothetical protein
MSCTKDISDVIRWSKYLIEAMMIFENTIISESSKLSFYREFYEFDKRASYVDELTNRNDRSHLAKLRLSAHSLEIERGRYS